MGLLHHIFRSLTEQEENEEGSAELVQGTDGPGSLIELLAKPVGSKQPQDNAE